MMDLLVPQDSLTDMCELLVNITGGEIKKYQNLLDTYCPRLPGESWYHRSCLKEADEATAKDVVRAVLKTDTPLLCYTSENLKTDITPYLKEAGFIPILTQTGMIFDLSKQFDDIEDECIIRIGADRLEEWTRVFLESFGKPGETGFAPMIAQESCYFYAYIMAGKITGTTLLYGKGENAGIHEVGVLPGHRGRGIARKLVSRALFAAHALGIKAASLQASEMGVALYQSIGFQRVSRIDTWLKTENDAGV